MAHIFANGIQEQSTAPGAGDATLIGAVAGFRRFSAACAVGDTVHYRIEEINSMGVPTGPYEVGRGTYSAANVLTRTTIVESSNANNVVNFTGSCRVSLTILSPSTNAQVRTDWHELLMRRQTQGTSVVGGSGTYGVTRITNPGGAALGSSSATETGAIKITLPVSWTNQMLRFTVKLYNYNGAAGGSASRVIDIGGYNYDSPPGWSNTFAHQAGNGLDLNVRFGHDGTNCCVWIGETTTAWQYPQVSVTDVEVGYTNQDTTDFTKGWQVSVVTSFGTVDHTVSMLMTNSPRAGGMTLNDSNASLEVRNVGGTGDSNLAMIRFWAVGSYGIKMGLRADGTFGIGGWSRAAWSWYTTPAGDVYATGNVVAYSDENLKTNWKDLPKNYVMRLSKVKVGVFDRTDTKLRQVGVSAQSLRKLLPWAVLKNIDGMLSVSYGHAALASAVELAKDNVDLRAQLKEQGKLLKTLTRRLDKLERKKK